MTDNNSTDFFDNVGTGGAPTAVLKQVNDYVHGEIVSLYQRDHVPYGKTEPEKNKDGSFRQELVVILQTENRNWANVTRVPRVDVSDPNSAEKPPGDDDGKRAIYIPDRSNAQYAIKAAITEAKAKFEVGGTLGLKVFNLKDTGKGNPLKEHKAVYTARSASAGFFDGGTSEAAPAAEEAKAAPAASPQQDPWAISSAPKSDSPAPF